MMNRATWDKLSDPGKVIWDQMTQDDKEVILTYAQNRGLGGVATQKTKVNVHDLLFEEDDADRKEEAKETFKISAHQLNNKLSLTQKDGVGLINLAKKKVSLKDTTN